MYIDIKRNYLNLIQNAITWSTNYTIKLFLQNQRKWTAFCKKH